jgi:two-component system CheB/CheR fusion protein
MVEELNHRVRNMLAVVTALAVQILRHSGSLVDFERDFLERIQAIAKSYALVSDQGWSEVELRAILADAVGMFHAEDPERFRLEGPLVRFNPSTSLTLGMVLHELATNAAKYGALSTAAGKIVVTWAVSPAGLELTWSERGGPPVLPPSRSGFGSILIKRLLEAGFSGKASFDYRPEGLQVRIELPPDDSIYVVGADSTPPPA